MLKQHEQLSKRRPRQEAAKDSQLLRQHISHGGTHGNQVGRINPTALASQSHEGRKTLVEDQSFDISLIVYVSRDARQGRYCSQVKIGLQR
jgi:hypothetical protein